MSPIVSLVFLLFISGVVGQDGWAVNYNPKSICVLKGSTVTMGCTYTYPRGHSVQEAFWTKQWPVNGLELRDLLDDPEYRGRVQYLGDKQHDSTLRLSDVTEKDQSKYYFRFITDQPGGKWYGKDGVELSVTDLWVEVPGRVTEGDTVTLTCKTTCSLTFRPTFTWYRNGHRLSSSTDQLHLQPVSRENVERYRCAVLGLNLHSADVTLNVRYGPKRVSVSISPSGYIVEGSSVSLTCSSDSNPPVKNYTWFKGTSLVATGQTYTINSISSVHGGEYKCKCSNGYIEKYSEAVTLNVLYPPKNVSVSISSSGEIVEGSSVTLHCSSDANPPVECNWFKGKSIVAKEQTYRINNISSVNSGEYKCKCSNGYTEKYSAVTVNVLYPPKRVLLFFSPSGYIVEGSSVTLHCSSSDANPPVHTYTWVKKLDKEALHTSTSWTYKITNISSADSGEYQCKATNTQGSQYSEYNSLTVLYSPKKVLVSISETAEGSSVTLTCSSDGNPPVQTYTWFKEGGDSPVGSGHSYSAVQSGSYYCVARNEYGPQTAAAVTITVKGVWNAVLYTVLGVVAGCGCLFAVIAVLCIRRKRESYSSNNVEQTQENLYSNVGVGAATNNTTPDPDPANQDDCYYASVVSTARNPRNTESSSSVSGTDHYQHHRNKVVDKSEGDNVQYASVRYTHTSSDNRCTVSVLEDSSVIYSSVN